MRKTLEKKIPLPEGVSCEFKNKKITCRKNAVELSKELNSPRISVAIEGDSILLRAEKANKNEYKIINSYASHLGNMFAGLNEKFVYKLEACNVHFPMLIKLGGDKITINNFLGEKVPRYATVLPNVDVQIKGTTLIVSSRDKDAAGQTVANIEKATIVKGRDRRVFQDGIFLVETPQRRFS